MKNSDRHEMLRWENLYGASAALAIIQAAQKSHQLRLVITPDMLTANRLLNELNFFNDKTLPLPVFIFPDWETLPYDHFSPHQDIISQRLTTLYQLPTLKKGIVIVPISTLMIRIAPRNYLEKNSLVVACGDKMELDSFRLRLQSSGYHSVSQVMEHGEYAIRGSLLDIFPMGSELPFRIDLFDEEVDTIRTFDPETQRSISEIKNIHLLPAHEFPLTEEAISRFRQAWRASFSGNPSQSVIYQHISRGETAPGIEYYLHLFFEHTASLLDYLPPDTTIIRFTDIYSTAEHFWKEVTERYDQLAHDILRPILSTMDVFFPVEKVFSRLKDFSQIEISHAPSPFPDLTLDRNSQHPLLKLLTFLETTQDRILFCAESLGRREALLDLLKNISQRPIVIETWQEFLTITDKYCIIAAPLEEGLRLEHPAISLICEAQLFGQHSLQQKRKSHHQDPSAIIRDLTELTPGSLVVHRDHGIGRYLGLQLIKTNQIDAEYLALEYANQAKLYVPVASLHLISRYSGSDPEQTSLHTLGSKQWEKSKRKAAEKIRDVAAELLDIYARRAAKTGYAFHSPEQDYQAFAASFPFEETPDQQRAIQEVIQDMTSPRIMDRLICGDVGFGKTEVAMRAAFMAARDGKQVAILVPTTLLAEQHYQNFKDRFAQWPITIEIISRLHAKSNEKKILENLANGKTDIVIGTHKLIQPTIKFKSLGLLIIDEEHRFGVQQKERIKSLRSEVDILTLTATPIPRTLNMSLSGMRDFSFITTPPARRLAIKTFVREYESGLIREAVLREIFRGGQVYFLHNEVSTIENTADQLRKLIPEARIGVAHGQMPERQLTQMMADFYHQRFNVLVCSTIVESGIDVPTANTIIIERADKLGLAQLHQLRGRVGRSHHQAYAYLLTPNQKALSKDALKRLDAIESLEDLGAGFMLATHDLEIRGAGELLGEEQSGHMQAIGFSLYLELLEEAVADLKAGKTPNLDLSAHPGVEIDLHLPALIPEIMIADVNIRLTFYKRIASAANTEALNELQIEMIDRFGLLPSATKNLFRIAELKLLANQLKIKKIDFGTEQGRIEFEAEPNIDLKKLIHIIQTQSKQYRLDSQQRLIFQAKTATADEKFSVIEALLQKLKK